MKRSNYILIVSLFLINFTVFSQENKCNAWIVKMICEEIEVNKLQCSINKSSYSFYKHLVEDSIIHTEDVLCDSIIFFAKKEDKIRKNTCDFTLEILNVKSSRIQIEKDIAKILNYTSYEKPPKIIVIKGEQIIVFSSWGAIYRDELYKIKDKLTEEYGYREIRPSDTEDSKSPNDFRI